MIKYFRPHIVNIKGYYHIRVFNLFLGWLFLDNNEKYWWIAANQWTRFSTKAEAQIRWIRRKDYKKPGHKEVGSFEQCL